MAKNVYECKAKIVKFFLDCIEKFQILIFVTASIMTLLL